MNIENDSIMTCTRGLNLVIYAIPLLVQYLDHPSAQNNGAKCVGTGLPKLLFTNARIVRGLILIFFVSENCLVNRQIVPKQNSGGHGSWIRLP